MPDDEKPKETDPIADEEAQLKAQLEAAKRGEQPEPPAEAAAAEPVTEEAKPAEEKPPAEAKPADDTKPPVETKPAEEPRRDGAAWKLLRQKEKELKEAREELARREATGKAKPEDDFEEHPADYLKARQERLDAELAQTRAQLAQRDYIDGIKNQEQAFSKDHPDYFKATEFLIDKDVKQWERAGLSVVHTNQILQAARSGEPRFAAYRENVDKLANDSRIIAAAEKEGRDPEELAAYVLARDSWLTQRRDLLAEGARARGRSVAEVAYEEAVDRGWNGNPQDGKTPEQEASARARVKQAQDVAAASRSLSDNASTEAGPERRMLRKRQDIIDADEATLDEAINSGWYKVAP